MSVATIPIIAEDGDVWYTLVGRDTLRISHKSKFAFAEFKLICAVSFPRLFPNYPPCLSDKLLVLIWLKKRWLYMDILL